MGRRTSFMHCRSRMHDHLKSVKTTKIKTVPRWSRSRSERRAFYGVVADQHHPQQERGWWRGVGVYSFHA